MSDMILFNEGNANLPAHLQGRNTGVGAALMAGIYTGGNRIGLKGSRFRIIVNGNEESVVESNSLRVIVVGAAPAVSRVFYQGAYRANEKASPVCYSADGIAPPEDVKQKQSDKCATCPQNIKGSKIADDGSKTKACQYFRRLVVMIDGDDEFRLFRLDAKAMTLFGESQEKLGRYSLNDYAKFLATRNVDVGMLITELSFDTDSSVPKVLFKPVGYIDEYQAEQVDAAINNQQVAPLLEVNMQTVDISHETSTEDDAVPAEAPVQQAPAQRPAAAQPAPRQAPATTAARPAAPAPKPAQKPAAAPATRPSFAKPAAQAAPVVVEDAPIPVEVEDANDLSKLLEGLDL